MENKEKGTNVIDGVDDDEEATSKKRSFSALLKEDDVEAEKKPVAQKPKAVPNVNIIRPLTPRIDPFADLSCSSRKEYIVHLAIDEPSNSLFTQGLKRCAEICSPSLQQQCFQRDHTTLATSRCGREA